MEHSFGIDIGGTTIKFGLFTAKGDSIKKWEIKTRVENEGREIIPDVAKSLEECMKEHNLARHNIGGIGVGVPAPVSKEGIVNGSANLGWTYKEVKRELEEIIGIPVKVENDANVAALGEVWKGGGLGHQNIVMVTLGTGVGGGIIVEGNILSGAHGAAGEIGHMSVNYQEVEVCGCGNRGCLEQYASATGIVRIGKKKLLNNQAETSLKIDELSAKAIFDAVKVGDSVADEIGKEFGTYLGYALANVAAIIDPTAIVIGGGVSKAGNILLEFIEKPYKERALFSNKNVEFALASLGNDAGICGAVKLVL